MAPRRTKYPCSVCAREVNKGSIECSLCECWVHKMADSKTPSEAKKQSVVPAADPHCGVPKDKGWAWMIVLGACIMHIIVVGAAAKSFGILFREFLVKFDSTSAATSWIVGLSQCLALVLGPLSNSLAMAFTARRVVFTGGIIMFVGFILSMFAPTLHYLYFSYGILVGIGSGLAYAPSVVTVGQYFVKRRAFANGLAIAGSGLGNFAIPPLMRVLLDYYGLQGALLVLAALMLHVCVCAMLLRPVEFYTKWHKPQKHTGHNTGAHTPEGEALLEADKTGVESDGVGQSESSISVATEQTCVSPTDSTAGLPAREDGYSKEKSEELDKSSSAIVVESDETQEKESKCCTNVKRPHFDWNLLTNPQFLIYALAVFLAYSGYPSIFMVMPDHADSLNISETDAALLVSIIGIFDVVGRVGFGWFSDLNIIKKKYIFMGSMIIAGISVCFVPLFKSYTGLAVVCAVTGLFAGSFNALIAVILAESLGVHRLPSAFGLVTMFMGMAMLFAPPIVGHLNDKLGSWDMSFLFCGVAMTMGGLVVLFEPLAHKWSLKKDQATATDNTEESGREKQP